MAESDVVVLVGVPLVKSLCQRFCSANPAKSSRHQATYGISEGVSGLGSGGGRFASVGCEACAIAVSDMMGDCSCDVLRFATDHSEARDSGSPQRVRLCRSQTM